MTPNTLRILHADDDPDDRMLVKDAIAENGLTAELNAVIDGEDLLDYLRRQGKYLNSGNGCLPSLILLDLNMPRKDGREALREVKADPVLRRIPVIVLTTSKAEDDILRAYELGANSFIIKPASFQSLVDMIAKMSRYWFEAVKLPPEVNA